MFTRWLPLSNATLPSTSANKVQSRPVPTLLPATNLVPRWRTMMLPAVTNSPPKRFHAQTFADAVAAVADAALTFLMCHKATSI